MTKITDTFMKDACADLCEIVRKFLRENELEDRMPQVMAFTTYLLAASDSLLDFTLDMSKTIKAMTTLMCTLHDIGDGETAVNEFVKLS